MTPRASIESGKQGFTLLEVMVAVAVLAVTFTAILTSESGAVRMAARAEKMGRATLLARCKMGEIEELVATEGLPPISKTGSDGCCEDAELEGYACDWEINTVELPESMFAPEEEDGEGFDDADPSGGGPGAGAPVGAALGMGVDAEDALGGDAMGGLGAMALEIGLPILKPYFEAQIRSAVVQVRWREGNAEKTFEVVQYLVADQGVPPGDPDALAEEAGE